MTAPTLPPGTATPTTRSVWSARDEAALQELLDRKHRIMNTHRQHLRGALETIYGGDISDEFLDAVINNADPLRLALLPFDGSERT